MLYFLQEKCPAWEKHPPNGMESTNKILKAFIYVALTFGPNCETHLPTNKI